MRKGEIQVKKVEERLKLLKSMYKDPSRGVGYWDGYRQALMDMLNDRKTEEEKKRHGQRIR